MGPPCYSRCCAVGNFIGDDIDALVAGDGDDAVLHTEIQAYDRHDVLFLSLFPVPGGGDEGGVTAAEVEGVTGAAEFLLKFAVQMVYRG